MDAKEPHYTAEQLRKEAVAVERMHGETLTVDWRNTQAAQLRAHAAALEENAELRRGWAMAYGITYGDDGELQNCARHPFIDFKRDPADRIRAAIVKRNLADFPEGK